MCVHSWNGYNSRSAMPLSLWSGLFHHRCSCMQRRRWCNASQLQRHHQAATLTAAVTVVLRLLCRQQRRQQQQQQQQQGLLGWRQSLCMIRCRCSSCMHLTLCMDSKQQTFQSLHWSGLLGKQLPMNSNTSSNNTSSSGRPGTLPRRSILQCSSWRMRITHSRGLK